jgi:hypothetical protein
VEHEVRRTQKHQDNGDDFDRNRIDRQEMPSIKIWPPSTRLEIEKLVLRVPKPPVAKAAVEWQKASKAGMPASQSESVPTMI